MTLIPEAPSASAISDAKPQINEPIRKTTIAAWKIGRRPRTSEILPHSGVEAVEVVDETTVPRLALLRAAICPDGVDRMQADAQFAVDALDVHSPWRAKALLLNPAALTFGTICVVVALVTLANVPPTVTVGVFGGVP